MVKKPFEYYGVRPHGKEALFALRSVSAAAADTRHETSQMFRMLSHSPFLSPLIFAICWQSQHSTVNSPPRIAPHPLNHPTQRPPHRRRTIVREADVVANHSQTIPHLQPTFSASSFHRSNTNTPTTGTPHLLYHSTLSTQP